MKFHRYQIIRDGVVVHDVEDDEPLNIPPEIIQAGDIVRMKGVIASGPHNRFDVPLKIEGWNSDKNKTSLAYRNSFWRSGDLCNGVFVNESG